MRTALITATLVALAPLAMADKLGDHPAVVVQRIHATQGYDYAAKFYPHPAWLYLYPEAPRMTNLDASLLAERGRPERQEQPATQATVSLARAHH